MGRLLKAHGLKGAIKIELYTDEPERRFTKGAEFSLQVPASHPWHGKSITLRELRWYNESPVAFFEGVDDRTAAEELIKAILWVEQATAELPAEDDAWYDHQLVGLTALRDGAKVGVVAEVVHLPAQDLLAIKTLAGDEVLVPFVAAIVPSVDLAAGTLVLTPPAGLFEELPDEETGAEEADDAAEAAAPEGDAEPAS